MTLKELLEARANISTHITEMAERCNDPDHNWTDEDETAWKRANDDYNDHTRRIEKLERSQQITTDLNQPPQDRNINPDGPVDDNDPAGRPAPVAATE